MDNPPTFWEKVEPKPTFWEKVEPKNNLLGKHFLEKHFLEKSVAKNTLFYAK